MRKFRLVSSITGTSCFGVFFQWLICTLGFFAYLTIGFILTDSLIFNFNGNVVIQLAILSIIGMPFYTMSLFLILVKYIINKTTIEEIEK